MKKNVNPVKPRGAKISPKAKLFNRVKHKNIGLDLDGVIIDHTENKIRLAREMGFDIKPNQTPGHRLRKIVGEKNYLEIRQKLYGVDTKTATQMKDVVDYLNKLKSNGYQLYIISARYKKSQPIAWQWVNRHLADIFEKQQIFFVEKESRKNFVCQQLNIDIYLDDKIDVLESLMSVPKCYLFDRFNIRNDFNLKNIQPVYSWQEFYEYVNLYTKISNMKIRKQSN